MDEQLNEVAPSVETEVERMEVDQVAEEPAADESQVAEIAAEEPVPEAPQEEPASTAEDEVPGPTAETPPVDEIPAVDETPPVDDTPPVDEAPPVPEESAPEENVQGSPHAMEMADFPEENQNAEDVQDPEEDPNKTLPQDPEKSMNETVLNSSAIDPFDAVKTTSDLDSTPIEQTDNDAAPATPPTEEVDAAPTAEDDKVPEVAADDEPADDTSMREDSPQEEDKEDDRDDREEGPNEGDVEEIDDGEDEDVQILADCEREITEADEESARLEEEREAEEAASEAPVELDDDELETQDVEMETEPAPAETETDPDTVSIFFILDTVRQCEVCQQKKCCQYRVREGEKVSYICEDGCVTAFIGENTQKYMLKRKKYEAEPDTSETETPCYQCEEEKICQFSIAQDDEKLWLCEDVCLNLLLSEQSDRVRMKQQSGYKAKAKPVEPSEAVSEKFTARSEEEVEHLKMERDQTFVRHCSQCCEVIQQSPKTIYWETMDFCHEQCLGMYQHMTMSTCVACGENVSMLAMGKYCVRFGFEVRQFCRAGCLEAYKKNLKCCTYCQENISPEVTAVVAHVGEKRVIKDFCSSLCRRKYEDIVTPPHRRKLPVAECDVCNQRKMCRVQLVLDGKEFFFCKNPCFSAFKFVNNVSPDECGACSKYFDRRLDCNFTIYKNPIDPVVFCSRICQNVFVTLNRIIAECNWCKVKKYNFDMAQRPSVHQFMCSINCLSLSELTQQAITQTCLRCDHCRSLKQAQYHLTMSDGSIRNFCMYQCVMAFQNRYSKQPLTLDRPDRNQPVPTGLPKRIKKTQQQQSRSGGRTQTSFLEQFALGRNFGDAPTRPAPQRVGRLPPLPLITSVQSLAGLGKGKGKKIPKNVVPCPNIRVLLETLKQIPCTRVRVTEDGDFLPPKTPPPIIEYETKVIHLPPNPPAEMSNAGTQCSALTEDQETHVKPEGGEVGVQTDVDLEEIKTCIVPVPFYLPTPFRSFALPRIRPVPFILPIPVPVFIPISKSAAPNVMKEVSKHKKVDNTPADPYEAELLAMAEAVAGAEKPSDAPSNASTAQNLDAYGAIDNNQSGFNEDLVQMALKMATNDYDMNNSYGDPYADRNRKRTLAPQKENRYVAPQKRIKTEHPTIQQPEPHRPTEKPDANMCLKYTFGVNAWKQWVMTKNLELEKSSYRRKPFKTEILSMTADELNYSLCLFVKEVRKPNGSEYAPDTIYYLVLGIQQYLYENGRIDNIFTDVWYEKFTDCLDEVAQKFSVLYNDSQYIVTRVEEEHLWECKQLGAHSPHVLLSTLMFFNTKFFNLVAPEEHSDLSFSHIMKHWRRNPGAGGTKNASLNREGARNVLLRFYPPQSAIANNPRKKKVYEQQENEENPLRCPVKLYEFYLSKCPESVKTRNDVFYLQPERSCVPDSPVWYSTQPLNRKNLGKMLNRVKMVKEINIALLTS